MAAATVAPVRRRAARPATPAGQMPYREQVGFAIFVLWCVSGLFLDGWSHQANKPETFFTPWHGLLYSGFLASTVWGAREARRAAAAGERVDVAGERLTSVGVALFAVGMVGDFAWHTLFGIEVSIDALISPTHLLLMGGGTLLASGPLRAALAKGIDGEVDGSRVPWSTFAPVLVSMAATTAVAAFFTMYLSAFRGRWAAEIADKIQVGGRDEVWTVLGIATVLVSTLVLVAPAVVLARRWSPPVGALVALTTGLGAAMSGLDGFRRPALVLAAVAGGLAAEVAVALRRPGLVGVAIPAATWPVWFAVLHLTGHSGWTATLWAGAAVLACFLGAAVSSLRIQHA